MRKLDIFAAMRKLLIATAAVMGLSIVAISAWQSNRPCDDHCQAAKVKEAQRQKVDQMWKCTALILQDLDESSKCVNRFLAQTRAAQK
jgi:hypothetical protein